MVTEIWVHAVDFEVGINNNGCCEIHNHITQHLCKPHHDSLFWLHSFPPTIKADLALPLLLQTQNRKPKMVPQVKIFIILPLLLFDFSVISADSNYKESMELTYTSNHEMIKGRKLLMELDAMLDYQEPGANPGHEPHKGNGGGNRGGN